MASIKSILIFVFSVSMYILSLATLVVFALFLMNIGTYTISAAGMSLPSASTLFTTLMIDLSLILMFALPHSIMARPKFKSWFKRFYDEALVRPTYLLVSFLTLNLLVLYWRPIGGWSLDLRGSFLGYGLIILYLIGWGLEVASSYQINHFHLFGLCQSLANLRGEKISHPRFSIPLFYRFVRHPIYTGWLMVFWITPYLTLSHLLFAVGMTLYIRIATYYEEQDLLEYYGTKYSKYMKKVPARYIPAII